MDWAVEAPHFVESNGQWEGRSSTGLWGKPHELLSALHRRGYPDFPGSNTCRRNPGQHPRKLPLAPAGNGEPGGFCCVRRLLLPARHSRWQGSREVGEMGRGKIEIKRIENATNRQVTYSKRKNGIVKKAREISVLCNSKVCLVIFSSTGKMVEFCSDSTTLPSMLEEYQKHTGKRIWDAKHESLNAEIDRVKKENDNLQIELRHLKGEDITPLSPFELIPLEQTLERGLSSVREKQMEYLKKLKKTEGKLEEENRQLNLFLGEIAMNGGDATELDRQYQENESNYPAQTPFSFRGQPIQVDLQNSK